MAKGKYDTHIFAGIEKKEVKGSWGKLLPVVKPLVGKTLREVREALPAEYKARWNTMLGSSLRAQAGELTNKGRAFEHYFLVQTSNGKVARKVNKRTK